MKLGYCFPPVSDLEHVMFVSIYKCIVRNRPPGGGKAPYKQLEMNSRKRMCPDLFLFRYVLIVVGENVRSCPACSKAVDVSPR